MASLGVQCSPSDTFLKTPFLKFKVNFDKYCEFEDLFMCLVKINLEFSQNVYE